MAALNDMTDPDERPVSVASVRVQGVTLDTGTLEDLSGRALAAACDEYELWAGLEAHGDPEIWRRYTVAGEWLASCIRLCWELGASREALQYWTGMTPSELVDVVGCWPCIAGTFGPRR